MSRLHLLLLSACVVRVQVEDHEGSDFLAADISEAAGAAASGDDTAVVAAFAPCSDFSAVGAAVTAGVTFAGTTPPFGAALHDSILLPSAAAREVPAAVSTAASLNAALSAAALSSASGPGLLAAASGVASAEAGPSAAAALSEAGSAAAAAAAAGAAAAGSAAATSDFEFAAFALLADVPPSLVGSSQPLSSLEHQPPMPQVGGASGQRYTVMCAS